MIDQSTPFLSSPCLPLGEILYHFYLLRLLLLRYVSYIIQSSSSFPVFQYYIPGKQISVFHLFQYLFQYPFHYSIHLSPLFFPLGLSSCLALALSIPRRRVCLFLTVSPFCLRFDTLAPSYRWYTAPLGWSSAFVFLALPNLHALPVCRQLPSLPI